MGYKPTFASEHARGGTDLPRTMALVALGIIVLVGSYSGTGGEGDPATWQLLVDATAQSTDLEIEVTRLGCASGVTGEVLEQ